MATKIAQITKQIASSFKSNVIVYPKGMGKLFGVTDQIAYTRLPETPAKDFNEWINNIYNQAKQK